MTNELRIRKLSCKAIIPTKCSRMAAGYDIYTLKDDIISVQREMLVAIGIAIG